MTKPIKVPENIQPFVEALGLDDTIKFLLAFGGTPFYIPDKTTRDGSEINEVLGPEKAIALGKVVGRGQMRIPAAKPFIAEYLALAGEPVIQIARRLHVSDVCVRRWLSPELRLKARQAHWEANGGGKPLAMMRRRARGGNRGAASDETE